MNTLSDTSNTAQVGELPKPSGKQSDGRARVTSRTTAADGVVTLTMQAESGSTFPVWTPGAHVDIHIEGDLVRSYSLCGTVGADTWRIGVLRDEEGRGGSDHIHRNISEGDVLEYSGPRNNFELEAADSYLFLAGGIGITPLLSMIAEAEAGRVPWQLVYTGRSRPSMAFLDELAEFDERVQLIPRDTAERVNLNELLAEPVAGRLVYVCGPLPLLDAAAEAMRDWPVGSLRMERFQGADLDESGNTEFEIELAQTGGRLTVPIDRSILQVLDEHDVIVETSCGEGICGSCEVGVLAGEPEHRDFVLSPSERESNESMMVCVSRCQGKLLRLDL